MVDRVADISSSINLILESMYRKPMTIIKLLEDIGLSKTDIDKLQFSHIREFEDIVLDSIDEYFQMAKYRNDFNILVRRLGLRTRIETLQEIGDEYGVTRESIRQRQNKALRKLAIPKLKIRVEERLLNKVKSIIYSSRKYRKFDTYDKAKKYVSENPGSDIAILDNDEGYLAKVVKTQSSVTKEIQSKTLPPNPNKSSQSNKTVDDYLRSMSLRDFADKSQCVTHRIKHCILNEPKDFGSLYEFVCDGKTRWGVLRIKQFGRKSFSILNECVENYIENIKIKIRKDALKNERSAATTSNEAQANTLKETDKVEHALIASNDDFFKIEDFPKVRLLNRSWIGSVEDVRKNREDNKQNTRLLNSGLPFTIEEVELFKKLVEQGKTKKELEIYFQRKIGNIESVLNKNQNRIARGYREFYWSSVKNSNLIKPQDSNYFKIESLTSTRLINLQWSGGVVEISAIRKENISQGNLINRGVPISIEEIELYEDFVAQGKSVDDVQDYFQRSIRSLENTSLTLKEEPYKQYQIVYWY